jgi:hypothetical protein
VNEAYLRLVDAKRGHHSSAEARPGASNIRAPSTWMRSRTFLQVATANSWPSTTR